MKFAIIKYNHNKKIKRILFYIFSFFFIITITIEITYCECLFLRLITLISLLCYFAHAYFIKRYDIIGFCDFQIDNILIIEKGMKRIFNHKDIQNIELNYYGYDGERPIYNAEDGTRNYLIINNTKYQIYIKNDEGLKFFKTYFNNLKEKGINIDIY